MPESTDGKRFARRIDADGRVQVGPNWETLIERQIREAMDEGKFNDLPSHGQPLPNADNPYAGDQALALGILKNANVAPRWIEADKELRELLPQVEAIMARAAAGERSGFAQRRDRANLETLVDRINRAVAIINAESPVSRLHRVPLRLAEQIRRYEDARRRPRT